MIIFRLTDIIDKVIIDDGFQLYFSHTQYFYSLFVSNVLIDKVLEFSGRFNKDQCLCSFLKDFKLVLQLSVLDELVKSAFGNLVLTGNRLQRKPDIRLRSITV